MKEKKRCSWCISQELDQVYHDKEWGVPVYDDTLLFEMLILEGAQAGVSWYVVLKKRERYQKVFHQFDIDKAARLTDKALEKALVDPGLIRNRLKIYSVRSNAQAVQKVQAEFGSFAKYIWGFVDGKPIQNKWKNMKQVPAKTDICTNTQGATTTHQNSGSFFVQSRASSSLARRSCPPASHFCVLTVSSTDIERATSTRSSVSSA